MLLYYPFAELLHYFFAQRLCLCAHDMSDCTLSNSCQLKIHAHMLCCRYTDKGRAYNPNAPTLGDSLNTAFISAVYANIQSTQISTAIAFRLTCWSRSQVRYVLGDAGRSLVSGWGKKPPTHVQVSDILLSSFYAVGDCIVILCWSCDPDVNSGRGHVVRREAVLVSCL